MSRWMRPMVAVGLAAALVLTGCGRDEGGAPESGKGISGGKATGEITVWAMGAEGENLSKLAKGFMEENPKAKVKVTPIPWDSAHDKISTAIAGGQTPDAALIGTTWMGEFAATKGLDPTPLGLVKSGDFFDGAWDTTVVDGTSYGIPWYVETRLLYVNKEVAEKAGVTEAPKNWDELKAAIAAFQSKGGAKWGAYLQPGREGSWQTVLPFGWQNGGDVLSGDNFAFDSPEMIEAYEYYQSYFKEGLAPKDLPQGTLEPDFVKGDIGAFVSGPWHMGILKDQKAADKYELWHMPAEESGTSFVGGGDMSVFSDAKNRDGAWKFVRYLARPDVQAEWYQIAAALPSVEAAWDEQALQGDPMLAAFGEQLEDAKSPPPIATWAQISAAFDAEMEKLCKTGMTPEEAAAAVQKKAASIGTEA